MTLPDPLVAPDVDLRDFHEMFIDIPRLFASTFHAQANDSEWRAGVTLWLKSFHQVPAASLPADDISLARLAEFGRDSKTWKKVKAMALYGWIEANDGRLYHPVVAEKANDAWRRKVEQRSRTAKARVAALVKKWQAAQAVEQRDHHRSEIDKLLEALSLSLSQTEFAAYKKSVTDLVTESKREGEGQREGQGQGINKELPIGSEAEPSKLSTDWRLPKPWGLWALEQRKDWNAEHVRKLGEIFADHYRSKGEERADWEAAWRNWVRREPAMKSLPGNGDAKDWRETATGITVHGEELGVKQAEGESFPAFKARVMQADSQKAAT